MFAFKKMAPMLGGGFAKRAQGLASQIQRGARQARNFAGQARVMNNSYYRPRMNSVQGTGYPQPPNGSGRNRNRNNVLARGVQGTGYPQPPNGSGRNRNRNNVLARGVQGTGYPLNNRKKRLMAQLPTRNVMLNRAGGTVFGRDPLGGGGLLNTGGLGGGGGLFSWVTGG